MGEPLTLAEEYARLNDATRAAHEAIKDLRTERRLLAEERAAITKTVTDLMEEAVEAEVGKLAAATQDAMTEAVARVDAKIDEYVAVALGQDKRTRRKGLPSIPEMAEQVAARATERRHHA